MKIHRKKEVIREARHKIENLFEQADLIFKDNKKLANRYSSPSQKIRVLTEDWVNNQIYCPNCGNLLFNKNENLCTCGWNKIIIKQKDKLIEVIGG